MRAAGEPARPPPAQAAGASERWPSCRRPGTRGVAAADRSPSHCFLVLSVLPLRRSRHGHATGPSGVESVPPRLLGAAIGLERQWRQRMAGPPTDTLVALGAAIFVTYARIGLDNDPNGGAGRLGDRLSRRWRHIQGGPQCSGAQHGGNVMVLGGGRAHRRRLCALRTLGGAFRHRRKYGASSNLARHQPSAEDTIEEEQRYLISIDCRAADASDVQFLLVRETADVPDVCFREVASAFVGDGVHAQVTAVVTSQKRREVLLEAIVARLSEISGVTHASWRLNPHTD